MISILLNVFAGWLTSLSFAPTLSWLSAFVGIYIWIKSTKSAALVPAMVRSFAFFLTLCFATIWWTGIYVGILAPIAISVYQAMLFSMIPLIAKSLGTKNSFAYAALVVTFEWIIRSWPFGGFGWVRFGFTQLNSPLSAFYPFVGVAGVTFILIWILSQINWKKLVVLITAIFICNVLPTGAKIDENSTIKVALIQGGVSQLGFDFNSNPKEVFNRHLEQTKATIVKGESNLIIWPENSVDVDLKKYPDVSQKITDLSKELNIPILVGEVANTADQQFLLNQSILFSPNQSAEYTKRYLTPFGEFIPLRNLTGRFSKYSDNVIDFKPGIGGKVFSVNEIGFNVKICYELLSDGQNREISDFSVVQTNNATFGYTKQLEQQLVIAKIRALESGRYFAYVSTTGITSIIDNNGKLVENLPKFKPATLNFEIPTANGKTINQRLGGLLEPLIFLLMLGAVLRGKINSRIRNGLAK